MSFEEFIDFIDKQHTFFRKVKPDQSEKEDILCRTIKVSEEFGELCDEVLASMGHQRKGKLDGRDPEALENEFADVVITLFLLARAMNIDIRSALPKKIEKIKAKHNKQLE